MSPKKSSKGSLQFETQKKRIRRKPRNFFFLFLFLNVGTPSKVQLFGHLQCPIFQSSILFTHYIMQFFKFLQILVDLCTAFMYCCKSTIYRLYAVAIQIQINTISYFHRKILALAGNWIRNFPRTKPLCYQLSYPGLDFSFFFLFVLFKYFLAFLFIQIKNYFCFSCWRCHLWMNLVPLIVEWIRFCLPWKGAMKRGRGRCGTFQSCKLMYLHILPAGMVYITLWYVHVPR